MTELISKTNLNTLYAIADELNKTWKSDWYSRVSPRFFVASSLSMAILGFWFDSDFLQLASLLIITLYIAATYWVFEKYGRYPGTPRWAVNKNLLDQSQKDRLAVVLRSIENPLERMAWSQSLTNCLLFYKLIVIARAKLSA